MWKNIMNNQLILIFIYLFIKNVRNPELVLNLFPPASILSVNSHSASRQFELQRISDRVIEETIKMEWDSDRMKFS